MIDTDGDTLHSTRRDESEGQLSVSEESEEAEGPLEGFDLRSTEEVRRAGDSIVDELMELDERYPEAARAQDKADGNVEVFIETAGLTADTRHDCLARERIRWLHDALQAWIQFIIDDLNLNVPVNEDLNDTDSRA